MTFIISNRQRAAFVALLIILAYSMLIYTFTNNKILGFITDILSGLAVIGIPLLMFQFFKGYENKKLNLAYMLSRFIEGILMIIGGICILIPALQSFRDPIYQYIHIYFFIAGALFFNILLYKTQIIPKFISIWGILATIALLIATIIPLFGFELPLLAILVVPIILNELFLAFWLMIKGFDSEVVKNPQ